MRARQPVAELLRGFGGRRTVERHQRRRHTGRPKDVGAPAIARDRRDFDLVPPAANGLFESMHGYAHVLRQKGFQSALKCMQCESPIKRSDVRKRIDLSSMAAFALYAREKKFACRIIHRKCTVHPQDFHTPPGLTPLHAHTRLETP